MDKQSKLRDAFFCLINYKTMIWRWMLPRYKKPVGRKNSIRIVAAPACRWRIDIQACPWRISIHAGAGVWNSPDKAWDSNCRQK